MNINQMKRALSTFRNADVSIIKDDALRAKAQKLQAKQKGFTLLELLVVITLLATLATAALVAYDGIGENARDASAATALTTLEGTLRNYRVIEGEYPEQFDSLANADAVTTDASGAMQIMSDETKAFFGQLVISDTNADNTTGGTVTHAIADSLREAGLEELQAIVGDTSWDTGYVPNLALNESYPLVTNGAPSGTELGFPEEDASGAITYGDATITAAGFSSVALSIVPSEGDGTNGCIVGTGGPSLANDFNGDATDENTRLNLISDALDDDQCSLVVAVGVGKDVPGATLGKSVEIGQVPTVGTNDVNPKDSYARAIALFLVAQDDDENGVIEAGEVNEKARLIGLVDPEGRTIDEIVAAATASTDDDD